MNAHVHTLVGVTTLVVGLQAKTVKEVLTYTSVAIVASVISDIDSKESKSKQAFNTVMGYFAIALVIALIAYFKFNYVIVELDTLKDYLPALAFVALTGFASTRPHREYAHSVFFAGPLAICVYFMLGVNVAVLFFIAQMSHDVIDIINKKPVRLLFPLVKKGICLNLVNADGVVSAFLGFVCTVTLVFYLDTVDITSKFLASVINLF